MVIGGRWPGSTGAGRLRVVSPRPRALSPSPAQRRTNPFHSATRDEALLLRSLPHLAWAAAFLAINLIYLPLLEERGLEARFGDAYRTYRRQVPAVLPRLRPWRGAA